MATRSRVIQEHRSAPERAADPGLGSCGPQQEQGNRGGGSAHHRRVVVRPVVPRASDPDLSRRRGPVVAAATQPGRRGVAHQPAAATRHAFPAGQGAGYRDPHASAVAVAVAGPAGPGPAPRRRPVAQPAPIAARRPPRPPRYGRGLARRLPDTAARRRVGRRLRPLAHGPGRASAPRARQPLPLPHPPTVDGQGPAGTRGGFTCSFGHRRRGIRTKPCPWSGPALSRLPGVQITGPAWRWGTFTCRGSHPPRRYTLPGLRRMDG